MLNVFFHRTLKKYGDLVLQFFIKIPLTFTWTPVDHLLTFINRLYHLSLRLHTAAEHNQ